MLHHLILSLNVSHFFHTQIFSFFVGFPMFLVRVQVGTTLFGRLLGSMYQGHLSPSNYIPRGNSKRNECLCPWKATYKNVYHSFIHSSPKLGANPMPISRRIDQLIVKYLIFNVEYSFYNGILHSNVKNEQLLYIAHGWIHRNWDKKQSKAQKWTYYMIPFLWHSWTGTTNLS